MNNARKILLVDEDTIERKSYEQALSDKGYSVTTAQSGEDALWKLGEGAYDIVVTEIVLRGISGLELTEEIHATQPRLPVVVLTDHGSEAARQRAAAAGVAAFLQKPLSPEQLVDAATRLSPATDSTAAAQAEISAPAAAPTPPISAAVLRVKNIILFLLAPFVGLIYLLSFPVVGLGMLVWAGIEKKRQTSDPLQMAAPAKRSLAKTIAMMPAAIVVGVFYAIAGPILGIGVLIWFGFQAWGRVGAKALGT